jgi:hypothetical protein
VIFVDNTSAKMNRIMQTLYSSDAIDYVPFISKELTSLPLGEAVSL